MTPTPKAVEALKHDEAKRKNIPTAEYQSVLEKADETPCASPTSATTVTWTRNSSEGAGLWAWVAAKNMHLSAIIPLTRSGF